MNYCSTPSVGIWWFYYDNILYADPVAVDNGIPYGDCITGLSDHADYWDKLEAAGELKKLPPLLRSEYFNIPRGRVVFHKDSGRYTILHGGLKRSELNKIRKFFALSRDVTDFDTDFHYFLNAIIK